MKLYGELASWWPVISPPEDYADEAVLYLTLLHQVAGRPLTSLLELGSGGGHLASHFGAVDDVVLLDSAPEMLEVSRALNPGRTHVEADMREVDLGRQFDGVLLHDAVMYLLSEEDLRAGMRVAARHCRPGGALLVLPDVVAETFHENSISNGRQASDGRSMCMLEWHWDPDPEDSRYRVDFAMLLRGADGTMRPVNESHEMALHSRDVFWRAIRDAGFEPVPADVPPGFEIGEVFAARRIA